MKIHAMLIGIVGLIAGIGAGLVLGNVLGEIAGRACFRSSGFGGWAASAAIGGTFGGVIGWLVAGERMRAQASVYRGAVLGAAIGAFVLLSCTLVFTASFLGPPDVRIGLLVVAGAALGWTIGWQWSSAARVLLLLRSGTTMAVGIAIGTFAAPMVMASDPGIAVATGAAIGWVMGVAIGLGASREPAHASAARVAELAGMGMAVLGIGIGVGLVGMAVGVGPYAETNAPTAAGLGALIGWMAGAALGWIVGATAGWKSWTRTTRALKTALCGSQWTGTPVAVLIGLAMGAVIGLGAGLQGGMFPALGAVIAAGAAMGGLIAALSPRAATARLATIIGFGCGAVVGARLGSGGVMASFYAALRGTDIRWGVLAVIFYSGLGAAAGAIIGGFIGAALAPAIANTIRNATGDSKR